MDNSAGSYAFETFTEQDRGKELARLKRQADVFLPLDKYCWEAAGLTSGMSVIDLGCGSGVVSCELARIAYPGKVTGIDLSESMLEQARWFQDCNQVNNITFQQGSAYELDFPDASFDFVNVRLLFQHLDEPSRVLAHLYRLLKPDGRLCVLDADDGGVIFYPEPDSFTAFRQAVVAAQQARGGDPFVGRKLGSYLHAAGFTEVKTMMNSITSDEVGLETFLNLFSFGVSFQSPQNDLSDLVARVRKDFETLLALPYAWIGVGIFAAIGHKL